MKAVHVIEGVQSVELDPSLELDMRHRRLPLLNGAPAKGKGQDVPKPRLALGGYAFPGSSLSPFTDMTASISDFVAAGFSFSAC